MSIDKQQKHDKHDDDQLDWVDIGIDDDSWVCDGIFDMWAVCDNKRVYCPSRPSK